jgi:hypothetical protein
MTQNEEALVALGCVAAASSTFEVVLSAMLAAATGMESNRALVIGGHSGATAIVGMLRSLSRQPDALLSGSEVDAWLRRAEAALGRRNQVMHSAWLEMPDGQMSRIHARGLRLLPQPVDDVLAVAAELRAVTAAASAWVPDVVQDGSTGHLGGL